MTKVNEAKKFLILLQANSIDGLIEVFCVKKIDIAFTRNIKLHSYSNNGFTDRKTHFRKRASLKVDFFLRREVKSMNQDQITTISNLIKLY